MFATLKHDRNAWKHRPNSKNMKNGHVGQKQPDVAELDSDTFATLRHG
jgi:hypothetical protein